MSIQVTLNIFSGRPNPSWLLDEAQQRALMELLAAVKKPTLYKPPAVFGKLGYKGFSIRSFADSENGAHNILVHEGIVDTGHMEVNRIADNRDLEEWLLRSAPDLLEPEVLGVVEGEISARKKFDTASYLSSSKESCDPCVAADAPAYNPSTWNTPTVQPYNNCYNYANNQITNTFAQPGKAHGAMYTQLSCPNVNKAAQADGLVNSSNFSYPLSSGQGWYVALVIWPGTDFHWYRQDNGGCWSHKPGSTAVRNVDNSGNIIIDPKTCDRGPYTDFCTYMITKKNVVIR